jgi:fermentation-respiration switch protein FrsA (DUF1100 family)
MAILKWLLVVLVFGYAGLCLTLVLTQRSLMYFPERARTAPAAAGLPQAEEVVLDTPDGEKLIAWHVPPRDDKPLVLYFHGNGGALRLRTDRFRTLAADGIGLLALSYRGYGGSTGSPSEAGLLQDAAAAYGFAAQRYPPERIVLWGESLGSAVAVALAAERKTAALILQAPFTAAVDIAASVYPYIPVRLLMWDQFRSDERIGAVRAPLLILHGERDVTVPIAQGERLYARAHEPKRMIRFPGAGHNGLDEHGAVDAVLQFLAALGEPKPAGAAPSRDPGGARVSPL